MSVSYLSGPDVTDIARPFLIGPIRREVAVQQVRCDVERMVAIRRRLEFACSFNDDPVFAHQPPDTPVPHIDADFLQFFGHPRAAIAAQAQTRLLLDVGQNDHIQALPAAGRAAAYGPQAARADVHHLTQPIRWERPNVFFDEPEPYGFWLAKNWVVGSTGQRNGSFEGISRRLEAKRFRGLVLSRRAI